MLPETWSLPAAAVETHLRLFTQPPAGRLAYWLGKRGAHRPLRAIMVEHVCKASGVAMTVAGRSQLANAMCSSDEVVLGAVVYHGAQETSVPTASDVRLLWQLRAAEGRSVVLGVCRSQGVEPAAGLGVWRLQERRVPALSCRGGSLDAVDQVLDYVQAVRIVDEAAVDPSWATCVAGMCGPLRAAEASAFSRVSGSALGEQAS